LGYPVDVILYSLLSQDSMLISIIDRLTSKLFLNLRSAAYKGPGSVQDHLTAAFPPGNRQDKPQELFQNTGRRNTKLDTILSATPPGVERPGVERPGVERPGVERSTYTEFEQMFSRYAPETQLIHDHRGVDMELQTRYK